MHNLNTMANLNQENQISNTNYIVSLEKRNKKISLGIILPIILLMFLLLIIIVLDIKFYKIHGTSMNPTLKEKEVVLTIKTNKYQRGDIIAFHHNNAIMIKRVVGLPNDIIDIKIDGTIIINNKELKEEYLTSKSMGIPDIPLPYTVPKNSYFVMGDNRADSLDSRDIAIGCVKEDDIMGTIKLSIIPLGTIK